MTTGTINRNGKMTQNRLPPPHGGTLAEIAISAPPMHHDAALELSAKQYADLVMISTGGYSPLGGFMDRDDYLSVVESMHLCNGLLWPMPVVLQVPSRALGRNVHSLALVHKHDVVASMLIGERFRLNLDLEASRVYGTTSRQHPGVEALYREGDTAITGELKLHRELRGYPGSEYFTPKETREIFARNNWRTVAAFQTRNPVHRAHEYLHKVALELVDGLFLNPLVGQTKSDDVPVETRMQVYRIVLERYYPSERTLLGVYPAAMRYAGPREAVLHAISRKNYGCTHFIVGRDHAGVGDYYQTYAAQDIFNTISQDELGIEILKFDHSFYCYSCAQVASTRTCPHGAESHVNLSGTKVREILSKGAELPPEFSRPEVAEILRNFYTA